MICLQGNWLYVDSLRLKKSSAYQINFVPNHKNNVDLFVNLLCSVTVVPTPPPQDVAAYKKRGESKYRKFMYSYKSA